MSRGEMESAAAILRSAIDVEPRAAILHARLGYVYRYAGLMDASISAYRRAQALDASPEAMISTGDSVPLSLCRPLASPPQPRAADIATDPAAMIRLTPTAIVGIDGFGARSRDD